MRGFGIAGRRVVRRSSPSASVSESPLRAIAAAPQVERAARRQLHGEPHHPVAGRAEAEAHASRRRWSPPCRRPTRRPRWDRAAASSPGACAARCACRSRSGVPARARTHGRIGVEVERHDAAQPGHRHQVRGRLRHRAAGHPGARAADGDRVALASRASAAPGAVRRRWPARPPTPPPRPPGATRRAADRRRRPPRAPRGRTPARP